MQATTIPGGQNWPQVKNGSENDVCKIMAIFFSASMYSLTPHLGRGPAELRHIAQRRKKDLRRLSLERHPEVKLWPPLFWQGWFLLKKKLTQINLLWPSDTIWWHGSRSTLVRVMACCLTAPSHYLNQCWLIISEVLWHSPEGNFTGNAPDIYNWYDFEND